MKKASSLGSRSRPQSASHEATDGGRHSAVSTPPADQEYTRGEAISTSAEYIPERPVAFPPPVDLQRVRIGFFKPDAKEVFVVGSFNDWDPRATPLTRDSLGDWSTELSLPHGEHRYRLVVDGEWRDDPSAQQTAKNPFGGYDAVLVV